MEEASPVIYGLEFQARALTAHTAEMDEIRFFVGTQSLKFENQVHQIDFDDENNIINKNVYLHPEGEIWQISASPSNKSTIATIYNKATDAKAEMQGALWKIPGDFDSSVNEDATTNAPCLEKLASISSPEHGDLKSLLWHPSEQCTDIITLADNHVLKWDTESEARISSTASLGGKGQPRFTTGKWNPHHNATQIATANENCIRGWDLRTMAQCYHIDNAHGQLVRDIDFNPNKQYYLASCGDDCKARFWDTRKTTEPVKILADHSHWIWSIRYNHFHDQLVLTSSSDSRVILTNTASISSEPFGQLAEEDDDEDEDRMKENKVLEDGIILSYEEHEDSVYAVEWSTADPWLFASLSYDGRVVINRVPRNIKYQILL